MKHHVKLTWLQKRKLKKLRKEFRTNHHAAALCAKNGNSSGHQIHFTRMREIYAEMRAIDPNCPSWVNNRKERRATLKERRGQPKHGPRLKSRKAKQIGMKN
jgi:hypothetical protein